MAQANFPIIPCDDVDLTCIACGDKKCDYRLQIFGPSQIKFLGLHHKCVSHHNAVTRWSSEGVDTENIILDKYDKPNLEKKFIAQGWHPPVDHYHDLSSNDQLDFIDIVFPVSGMMLDFIITPEDEEQ